MAEGLARKFLPENFSIHSAGIYPGELNQITVEIMQEIGIDLSAQYSKRLAAVEGILFDLVVVLAKPAWEAAQEIRAAQRMLWHFHDPVAKPGSREELKEKIRIVRDGIEKRIQQLANEK